MPDAPDNLITRVMRSDDFDRARAVQVAAFGPDEPIGPLLDLLRSSWSWDDELSFVAELDGAIVGHVLYSRAFLDAPDRLVDVVVLSPVGIDPAHHGEGIGTQLILDSLEVVDARGIPLVFLEGNPAFYGRLGFEAATPKGFTAPSVRIPAPAFQVRTLSTYEPTMSGALVYPDAFWRLDCVGLR